LLVNQLEVLATLRDIPKSILDFELVISLLALHMGRIALDLSKKE
jgi:hypothetical protein